MSGERLGGRERLVWGRSERGIDQKKGEGEERGLSLELTRLFNNILNEAMILASSSINTGLLL